MKILYSKNSLGLHELIIYIKVLISVLVEMIRVDRTSFNIVMLFYGFPLTLSDID